MLSIFESCCKIRLLKVNKFFRNYYSNNNDKIVNEIVNYFKINNVNVEKELINYYIEIYNTKDHNKLLEYHKAISR